MGAGARRQRGAHAVRRGCDPGAMTAAWQLLTEGGACNFAHTLIVYNTLEPPPRHKLLDEEARVEAEAEALQSRGAALAAAAARLASTLELLTQPSGVDASDRLGLLQL